MVHVSKEMVGEPPEVKTSKHGLEGTNIRRLGCLRVGLNIFEWCFLYTCAHQKPKNIWEHVYKGFCS